MECFKLKKGADGGSECRSIPWHDSSVYRLDHEMSPLRATVAQVTLHLTLWPWNWTF